MSALDTSWVEVGTRVAEYYTGSGRSTVRFNTVSRLTATQVVLEKHGSRYNRTTLRKVGENHSAWGGYTTLEPLTNPQVRAAYVEEVVSDTLYRISVITREKKIRGEAVLDEIVALTEQARRLLEKLDRVVAP